MIYLSMHRRRRGRQIDMPTKLAMPVPTPVHAPGTEMEGSPAGSELEHLQQVYELHDNIIQKPVSDH